MVGITFVVFITFMGDTSQSLAGSPHTKCSVQIRSCFKIESVVFFLLIAEIHLLLRFAVNSSVHSPWLTTTRGTRK